MPVPPAQSLILVTGVTGYIAAHVAEQLLAKGYRVRGTARTASKADYLKEKFGDKFDYVIVRELTEEGAFDEAVKGVDGIMHVASPFHYNVNDPKDLIDPAKKGTVSLLSAALKNGPNVKRIVITSSFAAISEPKEEAGYLYTEKDWNNASSKEVQEKGKDTPAAVVYRASKAEAEKSAWDFVREHKAQFDIVAINPTFVFGPAIHKIDNPEELNTSVAFIYKLLSGETKQVSPTLPSQGFVDVRDVAKAHVESMEREEAGGQRFLTTSDMFGWQEVVDILRKAFPERKGKIVEGNPGEDYKTKHRISNEQAEKVLGISFIPLEKSILDTAQYLHKFL